MKISPVLWTYGKPAKDGLFPVKIRISGNGTEKYVPRKGIARIKKNQWNGKEVKPSHPDHLKINKTLRDSLRRIEDECLSSQAAGESLSMDSAANAAEDNGDFYYYFQKTQIDAATERDSHHVAMINESVLSVFKSWRAVWPIKEVNYESIKSLEAFLIKKGNSVNTVADRMLRIKTVVNLLDIPSPFDKKNKIRGKRYYEIKKQDSQITALEDEELESFIKYKIPEKFKRAIRAQHVWLWCYNIAGMRYGDMCRLKIKNIVGGRCEYYTNKSGKRKFLSIKISKEAKRIADIYINGRTDPEAYIFPILNGKYVTEKAIVKRMKQENRGYNRSLKYIGKACGIKTKISLHVSRHTISYRLKDDKATQKLLAHGSLKTTTIYKKKLRKGEYDKDLVDALKRKRR